MNRNRTLHCGLASLTCCIFLLGSFGCGKWRSTDWRRRHYPRYEIAWVDPQIVLNDSLFTLIRAERIDSFLVERPGDLPSTEASSVMFHVSEEHCFTSVNLLDSQGAIIMPLMVRNLAPGYYQFTFDFSRLQGESNGSRPFLLKADYCGSSVSQPVLPDS